MPARDGTGPMGKGSRTGRGMGNCASSNDPRSQNPVIGINQPYGLGRNLWDTTFGRLFRRRRGRGRNSW